MMYSHYAFVSESGNYGHDFDGDMDTNYFVVTAVLMEDNNIESVRQKLSDIQIDQISMETSLKDREKIPNQLLALEFQIYCIVIDKKKLHHNSAYYLSLFLCSNNKARILALYGSSGIIASTVQYTFV